MPSGRKWGGVARRGAGNVNPEEREERDGRDDRRRGAPSRKGAPQRGQRGTARRDERRQDDRPRERREPKELSPPPPWEPEVWIQEPDEQIRATAGKAVSRGAKGDKKAATKSGRPRRRAPEPVSKEIGATVGKGTSAKVEQRLMEAAR